MLFWFWGRVFSFFRSELLYLFVFRVVGGRREKARVSRGLGEGIERGEREIRSGVVI